MKAIINFGLFLFFAFTVLLTFAYSIGLYEKIVRPQFKNLSNSYFFVIGMIVLGIWVINYFIFKRFMVKKN
jgi:hypothetical protein